MSKVNPYEPPTEPADAEVTSAPYLVDGPYLIVQSGVRLPMRCVITNQPTTSADLVKNELVSAPSFRLALARHRCKLDYCINVDQRHRIFIWTKLVPIFLALVALAVAIVVGSGILVCLAFGVIKVMGRFTPRDPMRINRRQGNRFWIEGVNAAFLADCIGDFHEHPAYNSAD